MRKKLNNLMAKKILVYAQPGARENKVEKVDDSHLVVSVKEPPQDGRANKAIEGLVAAHFQVAKSRVRIISGKTSRRKIVEIL